MNFEPENSEDLTPKNEFDSQSGSLPPHVLASAKKGVEQYENGKGISVEEFIAKYFRDKS